MKTIQPVSIWYNGQLQEAKVLNAYAVNVSLNESATFYYALYSLNPNDTLGVQLAQGNLNMTGTDYQEWQQDSYAWDWVAGELNVTITGDYVPPTPAPPFVDEQ
jgi:hypothetical protein